MASKNKEIIRRIVSMSHTMSAGGKGGIVFHLFQIEDILNGLVDEGEIAICKGLRVHTQVRERISYYGGFFRLGFTITSDTISEDTSVEASAPAEGDTGNDPFDYILNSVYTNEFIHKPISAIKTPMTRFWDEANDKDIMVLALNGKFKVPKAYHDRGGLFTSDEHLDEPEGRTLIDLCLSNQNIATGDIYHIEAIIELEVEIQSASDPLFAA